MIKRSPTMRKCISCKEIYDRKNLLKITKDHKLGIILNNGMGRSAYICKSKECYTDSKVKKKLQKALKSNLNHEFFEIFKKEIEKYK